jgi:hypothetical protein
MFQLYSADNFAKQSVSSVQRVRCLYGNVGSQGYQRGLRPRSCIHSPGIRGALASLAAVLLPRQNRTKTSQICCRWCNWLRIRGVKDDPRLVVFAQICEYMIDKFEMPDPRQCKLLGEPGNVCVDVNTPQFFDSPSKYANQLRVS